jgi:hypothetical protein
MQYPTNWTKLTGPCLTFLSKCQNIFVLIIWNRREYYLFSLTSQKIKKLINLFLMWFSWLINVSQYYKYWNQKPESHTQETNSCKKEESHEKQWQQWSVFFQSFSLLLLSKVLCSHNYSQISHFIYENNLDTLLY